MVDSEAEAPHFSIYCVNPYHHAHAHSLHACKQRDNWPSSWSNVNVFTPHLCSPRMSAVFSVMFSKGKFLNGCLVLSRARYENFARKYFVQITSEHFLLFEVKHKDW
jgi:hypothetical protein